MSFQDEMDRIQRSGGNPFKVLGLTKDASSADVHAAYKRLALQFHPDRINAPSGTSESEMEHLIKQATETFKVISSAFLVLKDPDQRKLVEKQVQKEHQSSAMVPFSNNQSLSSPTRRTSPSSAYGAPARRGPPSEAYGDVGAYDEPYRPPSRYDRGYEREPSQRGSPPRYTDMYNEEPSDFYDHKQRQPHQVAQKQNDPFAVFNSMFNQEMGNMFSGFGGNSRGTDRGMDAMGGAMLGNQGSRSDPFAMFNDMFGTASATSKDPFSSMFDNLSLDGGHEMNEPSPRGAFATQRVTRRHTSRNGDVRLNKSERSLGVLDMGSRGQMVMESSFSISGFQPAGTAKMLPDERYSGGGRGMHDPRMTSAPQSPHHHPRGGMQALDAPHHSRSMQDMSSRALQEMPPQQRQMQDMMRGSQAGSQVGSYNPRGGYGDRRGMDRSYGQPTIDQGYRSPQAMIGSAAPYERSRRLSDTYSSYGTNPRMLEGAQMQSPRAIGW